MVKTVLAIVTLVAAPAFADQSLPAQDRSARFGTQRPLQNDPYKKLFKTPRHVTPAIGDQVSKPKRQVVCGMTIIPADPSIDPKMAISRPANGIDYKMRAIVPPICNPAR
jgi:hypothetical protein